MKRTRLLSLLVALLVSTATFAQFSGIVGTVTDENGEPVIGASVVEKGKPQNGTITNIDGQFTMNVSEGTMLVVSYIGFTNQEVAARNQMNVVLKEDQQTLQDVVVIGYGVQKKSVVTAAIAKVSADDLEGKTPVRIDNALKGLAAGVNVTSSSGQPGASPRVRVRGTGTINNSDPLYIVDGMPIEGGIDFLNPSDIESIEVLKDAASGAIYGARAANGVVLVTTKKGKVGKASINYNFSQGWQTAWRRRDVTSATDYAIMQNELRMNGGQAPIYADPYNLMDTNGDPIKGFGTDWQDLVFNDNAPVQNHEVSVSGASEKLNYYLSMGYYDQEGIVGGNYGQSNYQRLSLRSNNIYSVYDATAERNFLNKLDVTVNLAYTRIKSTGISENSEWGSVLGSALYMSPIIAPTVTNKELADEMHAKYEETQGYELQRDAAGNYYTIPGTFGSYAEMNNPLALLNMNPSKNWSHKFVPKFSFDLQLWDNLKYHFNYSVDLSFWGNSAATLSKYYHSGNAKGEHTSSSMSWNKGCNWQVENTLTYDKQFGKHSIGVVLGQSAMRNKSDYLGAERWNIINLEKPYMSYTNANVIYEVDNYDEKYMLQATVRRDGSSRFGPENKYGTFPSVSVGWNIMNEKFMEQTQDWLSNLKFRASWGKNGSDNIDNFLYTVENVMGNNVLFGNPAIKQIGSKASTTANPSIKWEESEQTDFGLDFGFFNQALTFTVDYYIKKTNGMLMTMPIPSYVGENKPVGNVGDMENKGVEFELGYKWHVSDARFAVKANATYTKNTLKNLGNESGFIDYDGVQGFTGGSLARGSNGMPFPYFFGYKTNGVFQNYAEVNAYTNAEGGLIQPNARPGDTRFVDINGDGKISSDDRTKIGKGTPDWNFGLNFNADWRGIDFNMFFQGVAGADIFDATYRTDVTAGNYPTYMLNRWTGEGTSNKYPILRAGDNTNWQVSDLYIVDGSYLRLKNISLGYTLPRSLTRQISIERLRFFVMAENLITWTKYWGFDPEISSGGKSLGIDKGVYPQARTWTIGLNLTF